MFKCHQKLNFRFKNPSCLRKMVEKTGYKLK
ncbi:MAG: hypothetical protein RLZZ28_1099 [Bacteroidota bacterium]|jgi:hypothetical protein